MPWEDREDNGDASDATDMAGSPGIWIGGATALGITLFCRRRCALWDEVGNS